MMFARDKHKAESPSRASIRNTAIPTFRTAAKKKFASVQTNTDEYTCQKCLDLERLHSTAEIDPELRSNYIKSINYINSCHTIMNELLLKNKCAGGSTCSSDSATTLTMPDLPNFLEMYTVIQKCVNESANGGKEARAQNTQKPRATTPISVRNEDHAPEVVENDPEVKRDPSDDALPHTDLFKAQRSFIELLPDIKNLEKELPPENLRSKSPAKEDQSSGSDTEATVCTATRNLTIRGHRPDSKSAPRSAGKTRAKKQDKEKDSKTGEVPKTARPLPKAMSAGVVGDSAFPKMQKSQSAYEQQHDGVEPRKLEFCGDSGANNFTRDELFDKYAKELLETAEGTLPNVNQDKTEKLHQAPSGGTKKVKFADQMEDGPTHTTETKEHPCNGFKFNMNNMSPMPNLTSCPNFPTAQMFYGGLNNPNMMQNFPQEHPVFYQSMNPNYNMNLLQNQMPFSNPNPNFYMMMAQQNQQNLARMQQQQQQQQQQPPLKGQFGDQQSVNMNHLLVSPKDGISATRVRLNHVASVILDDCEYKKDMDDNSDTDYIPSDSDIEMNMKTNVPARRPQSSNSAKSRDSDGTVRRKHDDDDLDSINIQTSSKAHPLKLNERSLHFLDQSAMVNMGIFTDDGELSQQAMEQLEVLDTIKLYRAMDERNKPFRSSRSVSSSDLSSGAEILKIEDCSASSNSLDSSDMNDAERGDISSDKADAKNQDTTSSSASSL